MSTPGKFTIKVGDKIPLNEKPSDFMHNHLVVTSVRLADGLVWAGNICFDVDGSTWSGCGMFKRETMAGWDFDGNSSNNDRPDFSDLHAAFMRVPERHRSAAIEYICGLAD